MLKKLEKYKDKFGKIRYKVNSQNCKDYSGCGIYGYHIKNGVMILNNHIVNDMDINYDNFKNFDSNKLESLRASCWEVQLFDKKNNKWK